jgi:hypothetical protein
MPTITGKAVQEADLQTTVDNEISTAWTTIQQMIDWSVSFLPKLAIGITVFILFWLIGKGVRAAARRGMGDRPARNVGLVLGRLAQWGLTLLGLLIAVTIMFPTVLTRCPNLAVRPGTPRGSAAKMAWPMSVPRSVSLTRN